MPAGRSQREFFDSRAAVWEATCYPQEVRERLAALIPEFRLRAGACVLDVGTGPGVLIPYLREAIGPSGRICSFDLSLPMVRVIAHLLSREELARHHGGHDAVADDMLPDAESMRTYFRQSGLHEPLIQDRPGRYLAAARKK